MRARHERRLDEIEQAYRAQPSHLDKRHRLEAALTALVARAWHDGQRLPGHRDLARRLGVARGTLAGAIDTLLGQGLLVTDHGRGTWVRKRDPRPEPPRQTEPLSRRARRILDDVGASRVQSGAFVPGVPDIANFPLARWRRLYSRISVPQNTLLLAYASGGYGPLKRAIAHFLRRWRGLDCDLDQILITEGAHHGLQLCALALADDGDRVVMDSPCYWGARNVFQAGGLTVDHALWDPSLGYTGSLPAAFPTLLYVTGTHHYPLGFPTVSAHKQRLIEHLQPSWIIEDDYEFGDGRYRDLVFTPDSTRQILVGSFSKLMFPGLRLGYLVVPRGLGNALNRVRSDVFREGRLLDQAVLAAFIDDGDLDDWCLRMSEVYRQRQEHLQALLGGISGEINLSPPAGNLSMSLQFSPQVDDERLSQILLGQHHLATRPLSPVCGPGDRRRGLILGIGMVEGHDLDRHGHRLAQCLESHLPR